MVMKHKKFKEEHRKKKDRNWKATAHKIKKGSITNFDSLRVVSSFKCHRSDYNLLVHDF